MGIADDTNLQVFNKIQTLAIFFVIRLIFSFFSAFLFSSAIFLCKRPWNWLWWIHLSLGWTWSGARTYKNEKVTQCSISRTTQRPWNYHTSTPIIIDDAKFAKNHDRFELVCATQHGCYSFVTLCEHSSFAGKCFSFLPSRISRVLFCQNSYNSQHK